jgi:hypothetical protein
MSTPIALEVSNWESEFEATYTVWSDRCESAELIILASDLLKTRDSCYKNETLPQFVWLLSKLYEETVFFPSDVTTEMFQKLGFTEKELKWYTPLADIVKLFSVVTNEGRFLFHPISVLEFIRQYFYYKILDSIQKFYQLTNKIYSRDTNITEVSFHKFILRSSKGKKRISEFDLAMHQLLADARYQQPGLHSNKQIQRKLRGKVERICIRELFDSIISNPEFPEQETGLNQKFRSFYPLAQLIFKDEVLYTKEEFKRRNERRDYYDNDFGKYQVERLNTILSK